MCAFNNIKRNANFNLFSLIYKKLSEVKNKILSISYKKGYFILYNREYHGKCISQNNIAV